MAIGDTVQAGLGRMDFSAFQTAGAAQARANEAFGNALGQAATAYFAGKEKKERAKEIEEELIRQGANPDSAKAISKNPFLQNEYQRKQAADQQMDIAKLRVAAQRAEGGANRAQKAAEMETQENLRNQAIADQNAFIDTLYLESPTGELNKAGEQEVENFKAFAAPEDPRINPFIEQTLQNPQFQETAPVMSLTGNRFMEQFKTPGSRRLAYDYLQSRQKDAPKPMTPEQLLDYQIKFNKEKRDQAKEKREASEFEEENKPMPPTDPIYKESAINAIDSAIEKSKSFFATGLTGQALQGFAGTDARDLAQAISTVEAAVGFDRLQEMRDSSKTGGALGAINTKELELLSNSLGSLDPLQKPETLRANLESIKNRYEKILKSVEAEKYAFENGITFKTQKEAMDFIKNFKPSSTQQSSNTIDPADIQSEIERKKQMLRARQMNAQYFDNPNVPNIGNINSGN